MGRVKRTRPKELLAEVERYLAVDQPELSASLQGENVLVTGTYCLQPRAGNNLDHGCLDKFEIEVDIRRGFPETEPIVREVKGRIPRSVEHHINVELDTCCIEVWESWLAQNPEATIADFFELPLRNFFLSQVNHEQHGKFPFGEHDHGEPGKLAEYARLLECEPDRDKVVKVLKALKYSPPRGHWDCPCGSGKRIRDCCIDKLKRLSESISPHLAKRMLKALS